MAPGKTGPGYTVRDLADYSGFFFGAVVTYGVLTQFFEVNRLVQILGTFAGGGVCGFLADWVFVAVTKQSAAGKEEPGSAPPPEEPRP